MSKPFCENCIHHDICDSYSGLDIVTFFPHNEDCEYFKDAADVAEVRHGYWIEHKRAEESEGLLISNFECSLCHDWERNESDYCPNCCAKMDGKGEK